ncbi:MAG: hypothetical protein IJP33_05795, partial [Firmicutes bacterium]|nr:hypothetical protein [Bacillota bacterium]
MNDITVYLCSGILAILLIIVILLLIFKKDGSVAESEFRLKNELDALRNSQALLTSDANDKLMHQVMLMQKNNDARLEEIRRSVDGRMREMQVSNEQKLEQMRGLVDEKLTTTLEGKLSESFRQVSESLAQVHQGLGEM